MDYLTIFLIIHSVYLYSILENKYKEGSIVYDLKNPAVKMTIRRYLDRIYYCQTETTTDKPDMVFFERELTDQAPKA